MCEVIDFMFLPNSRVSQTCSARLRPKFHASDAFASQFEPDHRCQEIRPANREVPDPALLGHPIVRFIGPVPATAWLPIAVLLFPTSFSSSVFLIALATGMPVAVLTWSGMASVATTYYDIARSPGADDRQPAPAIEGANHA